jgi:hypothetical protein
MDSCEECGFVYDTPREEIADRLRAFGPRYAAVLHHNTDTAIRAHPLADVWSILEYVCHMRDVLRVQNERIALALATDEPTFASMRREERVSEERYNEQDPSVVAVELAQAADAIASSLDALTNAGWLRTGVYRYPTQAVRTVEWIGRHTIHEGEHHLLDVDRLLSARTKGAS